MLFYFMEFMERNKSKNLVNFWLTVESYSSMSTPTQSGPSKSPDDDDKVLYRDAETLYKLYFGPDASQPIKISKSLLTQLESYITRKPVDGQLFRFEVVLRIQKEVYQLMEKKSFRPFLESPLWQECRRELGALLNRFDTVQADAAVSASSTPSQTANDSTAGALAAAGLNGVAPAARRLVGAPISLGYIDDLGFFVGDGDDVSRDTYSVEIQEPSRSALSSLLSGPANPNDEDPQAVRMQAKALLADVVQAANGDFLKYDDADGI
eukprot:Unigene8618_Nuclearia_a/m.26378 Unigene8618_Nuclearia_a/g.26378  ORF Unigene8618_Nuclearia_a/g.26378 Unigene8618_Nuclearia_a/m.26378 type:complete len:266 (-) Unigene8618_Nuclearia_a:12-809(-)